MDFFIMLTLLGLGLKLLISDLMNARAKLLFFAGLFFVWLVGCSPQASYAPFCEAPVTQNDIAGTWSLAPESYGLLKDYTQTTYTNISLVLNTNGQLKAVNFPLDVGRFNSKLNFITDTGSWEIQQQQAAYKIGLSIRAQGQYLDIRMFNGKKILTKTLEDPDSGKVLVFER